jgi:hypothetical protein
MSSNDLRDQRAIAFLKRQGIQRPEVVEENLPEEVEVPIPELDYPPGFLGELAEMICDSGYKKQKLLSIAAASVIISSLVGQRIKSQSGMRANIYCLSVAPTAAGKEHGRRMIDRYLVAAGADSVIAGDEISSDAGVVDQLSNQPQLLFLLDEFGKFLKRTQLSSSSPYLVGILELLMKLYGLSDGTYRSGWTKTDQGRKVIHQPHVTIYGTSTPEQFWPLMNGDLISNGFLNRFWIFENRDESPEEQNVLEPVLNQSMVQQLKRLYSLPRVSMGEDATIPMPQVITATEGANEVLKEAQVQWKENSRNPVNKARDLWKRANDMCRKAALLVSISGYQHHLPVVTEDDMKWSVELTNYLCSNASQRAAGEMGETKHEQRINKVYQKISEKPDGISNRELARATPHLPKSYREQLVVQLLETGLIEEAMVMGEKRASRGFVAKCH